MRGEESMELASSTSRSSSL
uniref:Uncharacterized protein n=1 Tax=Arundo donax TaxID=35708 RepID=A0A0A8ZJD1_ARUDO